MHNFWNLSCYLYNLYSPYLVVFGVSGICTICLTITRVHFYLSKSFFRFCRIFAIFHHSWFLKSLLWSKHKNAVPNLLLFRFTWFLQYLSVSPQFISLNFQFLVYFKPNFKFLLPIPISTSTIGSLWYLTIRYLDKGTWTLNLSWNFSGLWNPFYQHLNWTNLST